MPPRNTINRITSRIDDLTKRHPPKLITIVGGDKVECQAQLEEMKASGKPIGRVLFIITGVRRSYRRRISAACGVNNANAVATEIAPR